MLALKCRKRKDLGNILVAFAIEGWPVCDTAVQQADVDIVEVVVWIHPGAAAVVYFESKVGRCELGLYWGKVGSCGWYLAIMRSESCRSLYQ